MACLSACLYLYWDKTDKLEEFREAIAAAADIVRQRKLFICQKREMEREVFAIGGEIGGSMV